MANTFFKSLTESDRTSSRTLLHEAIPITGTLVSGTYNIRTDSDTRISEQNIKVFSHGMFQSVYDYPYASSSANHIFDITVGIAPFVPADGTGYQAAYTGSLQQYNAAVTAGGLALTNKKRAIYNQMAQILVGYDTSGSIRLFDADGDFSGNDLGNPGHDDTLTAGDVAAITKGKILDPIFLNFSRLLVKDEIKKGSFSLDIGVDATTPAAYNVAKAAFGDEIINIADTGADSNYFVNSPAGEYGLLKVTNKLGTPLHSAAVGASVGLIYYQAGIVVLDGSKIFHKVGQPSSPDPDQNKHYVGVLDRDGFLQVDAPAFNPIAVGGSALSSWTNVHLSGTIDDLADGFRHRIQNISFNNTTELNSTIYFCRANHNEFNYSSNVTYLSGSQIRVKAGEVLNPPKSYATTVGLYSSDNELLAVAKLSEPLRKDPTNELTLRVRLDY